MIGPINNRSVISTRTPTFQPQKSTKNVESQSTKPRSIRYVATSWMINRDNSQEAISSDGDTLEISKKGMAKARTRTASKEASSTRLTVRNEDKPSSARLTAKEEDTSSFTRKTTRSKNLSSSTRQTTGREYESSFSTTRSNNQVSGTTSKKSTASNEDNTKEDTDNLSQYSKADLRQMLIDGAITRAEYEDEITSREPAMDAEEMVSLN